MSERRDGMLSVPEPAASEARGVMRSERIYMVQSQ